MLLDVTGCALGASSSSSSSAIPTGGARVHATIIPAGLVQRASAVPQANRQRWVAVLQAYANWPVIHHVTGLIGAARVLPAPDLTRVLTLAIDTSGIRGAIKVPGAGQCLRGAYQLANVIHHKSILADAHWLPVANLTLLVGLAGEIGGQAWIATLARATMTRVAGRAIVIRLTGDGWPTRGIALGIRMTDVLGLADVALGTRAAGLVQLHTAEGIYSASVAQLARVQALQVYARLLIGTL